MSASKSFDIKKYKSKFKSINDYFIISRRIKDLIESVEKINKITTRDICCSICTEKIEDKNYIDSYRCSHLFHEECLKSWVDIKKEKGEDPSCPNCRREKVRCILFLHDIFTYREWHKQYSGSFESVTRPSCDFAKIEEVEKLRFKRHILDNDLRNIINYVVKL